MDPTLDASDIQGNIIPGLSRNQQLFVALQSGDPAVLRAGIKVLVSKITPLSPFTLACLKEQPRSMHLMRLPHK